MFDSDILIYSLLGGILPAIFWLWFWLREDRLHPEPRRLIFNSFLIGMVVVFVVLPIEKYVEKITFGIITLAIWAFAEELIKFFGAWFSGIRKKECDEPIDPMIYLITVALGFASMENTLFIISSFGDGNLLTPILTGNLRFIGASLLHVLASGAIGFFLAIGFYKGKIIRKVLGLLGILSATILHTLFNFFIMESEGGNTFIVFCFVWVLIILLLIGFEKVKKLGPRGQRKIKS